MISEGKLAELIGRIYDAAADVSLWPVFLEDFTEAAGGTSALILPYDLKTPQAKFAVSARFDPEYLRQYKEYYSTVNPWIKSWKARLNRAGPETIEPSDQHTEFAQLKETEFYNDFLVRVNIAHQIGCVMTKGDSLCSAFCCMRPRRGGPFEAEVELVRMLFPHLHRAMQFHRRFAELLQPRIIKGTSVAY